MKRLWMRWGSAALVVGVGGLVSWRAWGADASAPAQTPVQRGEYLANQVAHCGACHTPRDEKGQPDMSRNLQGAKIGFVPKVKPAEWEEEAPDITAAGVGGKWNEAKMVKFLTTGSPGANAPMPEYRLSEEDARAMTAYMKSLTGGKAAPARGEPTTRRGERRED